MNIDHFGIIITFIILCIFLAISFLATNGIEILDLNTTPQSNAFDNYCKQLNIKC